MNILFCRYRNMCEPDYIEAYKALGVNVIEVFINEFEKEPLEKKVEILSAKVIENSPLFLFSINYFPYISIICQAMQVKYVSISVTCPVMEIYNVTIRNKCNRVFLFDYEQYLSVKDENPDCIFYLPLGAAVERVDTLLGDCDNYLYDISFVGSLYSEKNPFLNLKISDEKRLYFEDILKKQIGITATGQDYVEEKITDEDIAYIKSSAKDFYSSEMSVKNLDRFVAVNNYLAPHMTYLERVEILNNIAQKLKGYKLHFFTQSDISNLKNVVCHGGVDTLMEMPFVFRQSKVNLNFSTRSIKSGIPQRVWDVMACGGFLLTNYQTELDDYFEVGKHLAVYEEDAEIPDKIEYYLVHEDERMEIANEGCLQVKRMGTILQRVIEMIKVISR